jgi:hypothetical protein
MLAPEQFNQMGQELASRVAPGHLSWVTTHTEKEHLHNHIVICAVHSETGKRLQNKKAFLFQIRDTNDAICKEHGLSVLDRPIHSPALRMSETVKAMVARGKQSWKFDLLQKADFARSLSTSFDEFVATLKPLGVDARVENTNITYFYGAMTKGTRGKNFGSNFTKEGLVTAFRANDERFSKFPNLREQIQQSFSSKFTTSSEHAFPIAIQPPGVKNYEKYTKIARNHTREELPASFNKTGGLLYPEFKKAQELSLFDYCKKNKIPLLTDASGKTTLRDCPNITLMSSSEWTNKRNHTHGSIIEFVMNHDRSNYLHAVAKINKNPRLLLLEQAMGEHRKGYQSFYFPKNEIDPANGKDRIGSLLRSKGFNSRREIESISKSKNLQVTKNGNVWLFGIDEKSALEFSEQKSGKWEVKRHGNLASGFFEQVGRSTKLTVFADPFDFLAAKSRGHISNAGRDGIFVAMGDDSGHRVHEIMAAHNHINSIAVVSSERGGREQGSAISAKSFGAKFNPFDIEVTGISIGEFAKGRGQGIDL